MAPSTSKYLYLMAEVDVPTGEKPRKEDDPKPTRRVGPGLLSKLDLSQKEIESLPRGIVRKATADEIEAADSDDTGAETRAEIEQLKAEQEREMVALQGKLSAERSEAEAAGKLAKPAQREKFDAAQAKQLDALTAKHAKALKALEA